MNQMLQNGWCISEIALVKQDVQSGSAKFYLQNLRRPQLGRVHNQCSGDECKNLRLDLDTYHPCHVSDSCTCGSLGPDMSQVAECLRSGNFPVLAITGEITDEVCIEAVPFGEDTPYVAFSHVWADGLGNPAASELPRCQLARLRSLVRALDGRSFKYNKGTEERKERRKLYLWCDTLCCPVASGSEGDLPPNHPKNLALSKIRDVYEKADYVLVLDITVSCFSFSQIGLLEASWRILTSPWMRRLWTFQEAGLAFKLLVQFREQAVDFRDIMWPCYEQYAAEMLGWGIWREVWVRASDLRRWFWPSLREDSQMQPGVETIQHRGVSVSTDEPLCIGALFGLDGGEIARSPAHQRMKTVWRLLGRTAVGISQIIIFTLRSRLHSPGYRWAPATLLQPVTAPNDIVFDEHGGKTGILSDYGMHVALPGWRIQLASAPLGVYRAFYGESDLQRKLCNVRHPDGRWFNVVQQSKGLLSPSKSLQDLLQNREKDWCIILAKDDQNSPEQYAAVKGLLVSLAPHQSGQPLSRSEMVVLVSRQQRAQEEAHRTAYKYHPALVASPLIRNCALLWTVQYLIEQVVRGPSQPTHVLMDVRRVFVFWRIILRLKFPLQIVNMVQEIPEDELIATGVEKNDLARSRLVIGAWLALMCVGRTGEILETFDETQQWCVD